MCGLAGMAGNGLFKQDILPFKELLYISALRGPDSTGVLAVNTHKESNNHVIIKEKSHPSCFIRDYDFPGGLFDSGTGVNLYMGHTRWATVGKVDADNAHPFEFSQIIGMHNGTLRDQKYLCDPNKTDSEMMFRDMNVRGIKAVLEDLAWDSAYAITVYDKKTRKFYLARNSRRPLFVGLCYTYGTMYWASEADMLHMVSKRNNMDLDVYYLDTTKLYEIDVDKIKQGKKNPWTIIDLNLKQPSKKMAQKDWANWEYQAY